MTSAFQPVCVEFLMPNPSLQTIYRDYFAPRKKVKISIGKVRHYAFVEAIQTDGARGRVTVRTTGAPLAPSRRRRTV